MEEDEGVQSLARNWWGRCPLGATHTNRFCPGGTCSLLQSARAQFEPALEQARQVHAARTGVVLCGDTFLKNVCRTARVRAANSVEDAFLSGLQSEDLYLVTAMAQYAEQAWELFLQRYRNLVGTILRCAGLSAAEREDAFADMCVDLLERDVLSRFRGTGSLERWLARCARIQALRCRAKRGAAESLRAEPRSDARSPSDAAAQAEELARLQEALRRLSGDELRAVRLRYFDGCRLSEIALQLGRRHANQTRRILTSGLAKLRCLMDG